MAKKKLSHYDSAGKVSMVDVGGKKVTERTATARAFVSMSPEVIAALPDNAKGDPLEIARIAGICAAKRTADLIPLCHQLPLSFVGLDLQVGKSGVEIVATARTAGQTGVEIREVYLLEKTGGKSGKYRRVAKERKG